MRNFGRLYLFIIFSFFATNSSAQLKVIISGGLAAAYQEILPEFVSSTGIEVETGRGASVGDSPSTIPNQLKRGVGADVVILARQGLDEISISGLLQSNSDIDLAVSTIGMVVQKGKPKPDISTPAKFRSALLNARKVAVSSSIGIQQVSELLPIQGADFVGKLPEELQYTTTFSAAIVKTTTRSEAARLLIEFLASAEAAEVINRWGMTPINGL